MAVFSHYRDETRVATSWAPLCDYSPEWIALRDGRAAGAQVRFIDLPAWHPAFTERAEGAANRYADAEARYAEATARLCERFSVDSVDALWDGLFEVRVVLNESQQHVRTLRAWLRRLKAHHAEAAALVGEEAVAAYQRYLRLDAIVFAQGRRDLLQITLQRLEEVA